MKIDIKQQTKTIRFGDLPCCRLFVLGDVLYFKTDLADDHAGPDYKNAVDLDEEIRVRFNCMDEVFSVKEVSVTI